MRTKNSEPSAGQLQTLEHLRKYIDAHGYSPTVVDLAVAADVAPNCIQERIGKLLGFGLITKTPGIPRSIRPISRRDGFQP